MSIYQSAVFVMIMLAMGCGRSVTSTEKSDPLAGVIEDARVRALVRGHENQVLPLIEGSFDGMLTETFGEIRASLERQHAEGNNPPKWPGSAAVDLVGRGIFSKRTKDDQPGAISLSWHHNMVAEVIVSKKMIPDEIHLAGERYLRDASASLFMIWNKHGLSDFRMDFTIKATRPWVVERLPKYSIAHEYYLSGSFSLIIVDDEKGDGAIRLFHYDPLDSVRVGEMAVSAKLLSREPLLERNQEMPQEAKRHLLEIMKILTKHGPRETEDMIFQELLEGKPLRLRREQD